MLVIGIESSAHTFGVGIVENGRILANEKSMYKITTKGLIPAKVAEFHALNASDTIQRALETAGIEITQIEGVGYTRGPGLGPCLQVGELTAKTIAKKLGVKIIPLNHGLAHIEITKNFAKFSDPLVLYVSGGNSQLLKLDKKLGHYQILGETFDVGVGNMLDAFARELKLNPSWGSMVAQVGREGKYVKLPYTVKGMDFAFTGLLTSATKLIGKETEKDLCFSIQETAFSMLCEATERALLLSKSRELCVCGGVAQSSRLREMLEIIAKDHRVRFGFAPNEFNADNGAMIAMLAERMLKSGISVPIERCDIMQRFRIDKSIAMKVQN